MQQPGFWNWKIILIGAQMLFVAFGAMVLMPLLTGLDPSVALFTAGLGTLLFQWITRRSVPVFLASSFVFVAPIAHGVEQWGVSAAMGALLCTAVVYVVLGGAGEMAWSGISAPADAAGGHRPYHHGDRVKLGAHGGELCHGHDRQRRRATFPLW